MGPYEAGCHYHRLLAMSSLVTCRDLHEETTERLRSVMIRVEPLCKMGPDPSLT